MFTNSHYVPVLKGKRGEFDALSSLSPSLHGVITPILEVPPVPIDYDTGTPTRSVDDHLDTFVVGLCTAWGQTAFIDVADDLLVDSLGRPAIESAVRRSVGGKLTPVPVTGPEHSGQHDTAVQTLAATNGLAIRVPVDVVGSAGTRAFCASAPARYGVPYDQIDLMVDLASRCGTKALDLADAAAVALAEPSISTPQWRTLTVLLSAFPESVAAGVAPRTIGTITREDVLAYRDLAARPLTRIPTYGDYQADNPTTVDFDPRFMRSSATIRYTLSDEWLIVRGGALHGPGGGGFAQFRSLASSLLSDRRFVGPKHCVGCGLINDCAAGTSGTGNLTTWRSVATDHHLTMVGGSVATTGGP